MLPTCRQGRKVKFQPAWCQLRCSHVPLPQKATGLTLPKILLTNALSLSNLDRGALGKPSTTRMLEKSCKCSNVVGRACHAGETSSHWQKPDHVLQELTRLGPESAMIFSSPSDMYCSRSAPSSGERPAASSSSGLSLRGMIAWSEIHYTTKRDSAPNLGEAGHSDKVVLPAALCGIRCSTQFATASGAALISQNPPRSSFRCDAQS